MRKHQPNRSTVSAPARGQRTGRQHLRMTEQTWLQRSEGTLVGACLCIVVTTGCGATKTPARPGLRVEAVATVVAADRAQPPTGEYVPCDEAIYYGRRHFGGHGRALVNGVRVALDEPPGVDAVGTLLGGTEIPGHLGKGFLFWDEESFYRSDTFSGLLRPAGRLPLKTRIRKVSFGPSVIVFHVQANGRFAWSLATAQVAEMPTTGLIDIAPFDERHFVQWVEPGELQVPLGEGAGTTLDTKGYILEELGQDSGKLEITTSGPSMLVASGEFSLVPRDWPRQEKLGRNRIGKEYWRGEAFANGISVGGDVALMEEDSVFAKIDLRSGRILDVTEPVLVRTCTLFPVPNDILALCTDMRQVVSGLGRFAPRIERAFSERKAFFLGSAGFLLREGPCNGPSSTPLSALCIRDPRGDWRELDIPPNVLPMLTGKSPIRWVPTSDGGAIGMVTGEQPGYYDATTKRFVPLPAGALNRYDVDLRPSQGLNDGFTVLPDGTIAGYLDNGLRHWNKSGEISAPMPRIKSLSHRGPNALGLDEAGHLLQSTDFGMTWQTVAAPRHGSTQLVLGACSYAGCWISDWYRIGYPATHAQQPSLESRPLQPEIEPPHVPPLRLQCRTQGKTTPGGSRSISSYLALAPGLFIDDYDPKLKTPRSWPVTDWTFFDSSAQTAAPDLQSPRLVPPGPGSSSLSSTYPVLTEYPERIASAYVFDWRGSRRIGFHLGGRSAPFTRDTPLAIDLGRVTSIALDRAGRQYYLERGYQEPWGPRDVRYAAVRRLEPGYPVVVKVRDSYRLGLPNPDVIALGANGKAGILRIRSLWPATKDDPALVITANDVVEELAPWSTLQIGACDGQPGYRAIVAVSDWLGLTLNGAETDISRMTMLVHWNDKRLCLEAAEGALSIGPTLRRLHLVAEFGAKPQAFAYQYEAGRFYVQPMTCALPKP